MKLTRYHFLAASLLVFGLWVRYFGPDGVSPTLVRAVIHVGLLIWWGISILYRIVNKRVRLLLLLTDLFMIFWIVVKTLKYETHISPAVTRYLWYLYYVPWLIIPLFVFSIALFSGKAESYRIPKPVYLVHAVSLFFLVLVLTNDLHQLVFTFHSEPFSDSDYSYNIGSYALLAWCYSIAMVSLVRLVGKNRDPKIKRKLLIPVIPFLLLFTYAVLYILRKTFVVRVFRDITTVNCFLFVVILEACIGIGLIASNRQYLELFELCTIPMALEQEGEKLLTSGAGFGFRREWLSAALEEPVITPENQRITSKDIGGMRVYWASDLAQIREMSDRLQSINEELEESNEVARFEYEEQRKNLILKEKNRVYNKIQQETKDRLLRLEKLFEQVRAAQTFEKERELLLQIAVLSVYIKRRNNLLFEAESGHTARSGELERAFAESLQYLEDFGIGVSVGFMPDREMEMEEVTELFNAYETILEAICLTVCRIRVTVSDDGGTIRLSLLAEADWDYTALSLPGIEITREDERDYLFDYAAAGTYAKKSEKGAAGCR